MKFLKYFFGLNYLQSIFVNMHKLSLRGMNFGNSNILNNGELFLLEKIQNNVSDNTFVIFDAGANIGDYTEQIIRIFPKDNVQIFSFEPSKMLYKQMINNISDDRVFPQNIGLSHEKCESKIYMDTDNIGLTSLYNRRLDHHNKEMNTTESIHLTTIDEFCKEKNVNEIDFLKLDIEGHELEALKGAKNMLQNNKIKRIQFELGGCNIDSRTFFQDFWYLLKDDYNLYRIVKNGLVPIKAYKETMEVFATINYYAELKKLS